MGPTPSQVIGIDDLVRNESDRDATTLWFCVSITSMGREFVASLLSRARGEEAYFTIRESNLEPISCDARDPNVRPTADVSDNCAGLIRLLVYRRAVR